MHPALNKARSQLIMQQPFFGALALGLRVEMTEAEQTMAVDGRTLFANPQFVESISERELLGVVAHEVLHCAYLHHTRRNGRDAELWNVAADYAINRDLLKAGFTLPQGALFDSRFDGLGAESIYAELSRQQQKQGGQSQQSAQGAPSQPQPGQGKPGNSPSSQSGNGAPSQGAPQPGKPSGNGTPQPGQPGRDPGKCGAVRDASPEHDPAANSAAEADMQARVRQAMAVAKASNAGKLPAALEMLAATLAKPRLDCRAMFRRFIDESTSRDYSWLRPNRRHVARGLILPGYVPDRPSHIVAMIDSSGSMDSKAVAELTGEIQAALDEGAADRVTVAYADTRVGIHATYEPGERIELTGAPRGGTSFRQPFDWIAEHCPDASAVLYLTDLETSDFGNQPACPVMWIVTGDPRHASALAERAPFGESVILES